MEAMKRIALVTGGNKGIGFGICKQLASKGVTVILTARDEKRGQEAIKKLSDEFGITNVIFHQLDLTNNSHIVAVADFVKTRFGKLDVLVNNAAGGGYYLPQPLDMQISWEERHAFMTKTHIETYELVEECLKINYFGMKYLTEALLPLLQSSDSGRVVNISSNAGRLRFLNDENLVNELDDINKLTLEKLDDLAKSYLKSFKEGVLEENGWKLPGGFGTYKISKIFVNAYTRIVAKMYPDLCINCVQPGHTQTEGSSCTGSQTVEEAAKSPVTIALDDSGRTGLFYDRTEITAYY